MRSLNDCEENFSVAWRSASIAKKRAWDQIQGNWKQVGKAKDRWGKLTDGDFDVVAGRRDQLAGKIQERYGVAKDEAEKQVTEWERKATDSWFGKDSKNI
jgi:uncharacterized protein YjbJ (UPF0337 family)